MARTPLVAAVATLLSACAGRWAVTPSPGVALARPKRENSRGHVPVFTGVMQSPGETDLEVLSGCPSDLYSSESRVIIVSAVSRNTGCHRKTSS
eukprot:6007741-Prymnesium_polylepis.1